MEEKQTKRISQREDKEEEVKIIQLLITPNNSIWQGQLLGLGSNGITYIMENNKWVPVIQNIDEGRTCGDKRDINNALLQR